MGLTVPAAALLARHQADEHLELLLHRTFVENRLVQIHEGLRNSRPALHGEDAVRHEAAGRLVVLEAFAELRVGFPR